MKDCYGFDNHSYNMPLINKFFNIRKNNSMDEYLMDIMEAANLLKEVELPLLESIVCYYIKNNLPKEYEVIKQMIFNDRVMPSHMELESKLLIEEARRKLENRSKNKALLLCITHQKVYIWSIFAFTFCCIT